MEYRDAFLGRFEALMDAQDVAMSGRSTADFADIVAKLARLAPSTDALVARGPSVRLAASQVLPLSLVLHELATNALKYGALSANGGKVTVDWCVTARGGGGDTLEIEWREEGGPPTLPPQRSGFGSQLIEFSIAQDLGGAAELHFEPGGFHGAFAIPIG